MMHLDCDCGRKVFVAVHQAGQKVICSGCGAELEAPPVPFFDQAGRSCPLCGSRSWKKIFQPADLNKKLAARTGFFKEYTHFFFVLPRECGECSTIWFPPLGKGALALTLLMGMMVLGAMGLVLVRGRGNNLPRFDFLLYGFGAGILLVLFSFWALAGKIAKAKIVSLGKIRDERMDP
jgi:hypothetical protein